MEHLSPLADDPVPPPSPSHTHSSHSSNARSPGRPVDLCSLSSSSRESDWSEGEGDGDETFDLVSSSELPPSVADPSLAPRALSGPSSMSASASDSASVTDESDPPERMRLSFPDPLDTSSSCAASDSARAHSDAEPRGALEGSTLLDGEGAYSLLLDARPTPAVSSASYAPSEAHESGPASGLTSPLLRAQADPRALAADEDRAVDGAVGGVEEWVRRMQLSAQKREQGMRERAVQTVRSAEADEVRAGTPKAEQHVACSALSSMASSSLVSSQATVVPASAAPAPAVGAVGQATGAQAAPVPAKPTSSASDPTSTESFSTPRSVPHAHAQRRRTLLAVALTSALVLSASAWLASPSSAAGRAAEVVEVIERGVRSAPTPVQPVKTSKRAEDVERIADTGWLEAILPVSSSAAPSSTSSTSSSLLPTRSTGGTRAASSVASSVAPSASPLLRVPAPVYVPGTTGSAAPHLKAEPPALSAPTAAVEAPPCAACALSTVPVAGSRALAIARHRHRRRKPCAHARRRHGRVELSGAKSAVALAEDKEEDGEEVSLFRGAAGDAGAAVSGQPSHLADNLVAAPSLPERVRERAHTLLAQRALPVDAIRTSARRIAHSVRALATTPREAALMITERPRAQAMDIRARARRTLEAIVRPMRDRVPAHGSATHDAVLAALFHSRHAVQGRADAGRRAMLDALVAAELPRRARSALRRASEAVPSRRDLRRAASTRLATLDIDIDALAALSRLRSRASARLARATEARAVVLTAVSSRLGVAARSGGRESKRHVKRAARTVKRLQRGAVGEKVRKVERRGRRGQRA
ncbi:hypothetical protein DMC30DRAFT_409750 [Rhodotorula diobovata]|uniref:Uncharacterized protein n=1 Tax=Rhodotorula diobovata TaxID=5288 RepID=A0A5C5FPQ2_9BASI|nr:hypothetical protein DMC30DRAFT_409750 [Rhodotorula diobovata]